MLAESVHIRNACVGVRVLYYSITHLFFMSRLHQHSSSDCNALFAPLMLHVTLFYLFLEVAFTGIDMSALMPEKIHQRELVVIYTLQE